MGSDVTDRRRIRTTARAKSTNDPPLPPVQPHEGVPMAVGSAIGPPSCPGPPSLSAAPPGALRARTSASAAIVAGACLILPVALVPRPGGPRNA